MILKINNVVNRLAIKIAVNYLLKDYEMFPEFCYE